MDEEFDPFTTPVPMQIRTHVSELLSVDGGTIEPGLALDEWATYFATASSIASLRSVLKQANIEPPRPPASKRDHLMKILDFKLQFPTSEGNVTGDANNGTKALPVK